MDDCQRNLSEQLQLLHELQYSDLDMPYQGSGTHSNQQSRDADTKRDVRLLDTIAVALTTGNTGDVFAAAFDKREKIRLVLAKNGPPTPEDVRAANELIALIGKPAVSDAMDLFPFLLRRCGANIDKRIRNLQISIRDAELHNDFRLALESYEPLTELTAELPGANGILGKYGNGVPPFSTVWGDFVEKITNITAHGLDAQDVAFSTAKYAQIFLLADALGRSRFLKSLTEDRSVLNSERKGRAEKLKRRLDKVCQYVGGVSHLVRKAKPLFPIAHHWVSDNFTGSGEFVFDLCDNAYDAVSRALGAPYLSAHVVDTLDKRFPSMLSNWERQKTMHTCLHAELRIILHLGPPLMESPHPIGVSKRSCFCCMLWIASHNRIFGTQWMTSGSHGKPYANWSLPGAACSHAIQADGRSSVDEAVLKAVSARLTDALDWLFPGRKRVSDEHISSGDESSDGEPGASSWRLKVAHIAEQYDW